MSLSQVSDFNHVCKVSFPYELTYSQILELGWGHLWIGGIILPTTVYLDGVVLL